jgi:outer membrane protein assembly factor BamB
MWHKKHQFVLIAVIVTVLMVPAPVTQLASASGHQSTVPTSGSVAGAVSWNKLEPGWTMFQGGSGINGSYSGYFPWTHFGIAWESSFPNTSYAPENTIGESPQASPLIFDGTVYLMASATPSVLEINATTGTLVNAFNLASMVGTATGASVVSTPLIGEYNNTPFLTVNEFSANPHETFSVNLTSGATVYCHSAVASTGGSAPLPGGFVEPTRNGAILFSSWALGDNGNAHCTNVATMPSTDSFSDTPSVGLTYYPSIPAATNATFFLSDQSTAAVDSFAAAGTSLWADKLDEVANGSLALTNTTYISSVTDGPIVAPIGFIADDGGLIAASHLYAVDVNCGVKYCFSDANTSNTLPGGAYALPPPPPGFDGGVNSTVALRTVSPNSTQVFYASRDGSLGAVTATVEGSSPQGPFSMNGYKVNWTNDWTFQTGANITASPVTANGFVMVGNDAGMFYILNATTGAPVWEHQLPGSISASPALYNGEIYQLTMNGTLVAIGPSSPIASIQVAPQVPDDLQTSVSVMVNATGPTGLASGPLGDASATLLVSGGVYTATERLGTTDTLANGLATFNWTPPYYSTNAVYDFMTFVNATGYSMTSAMGNTLALPPPTLTASVGAAPGTFTLGGTTFINVTTAGGFLPYTYTYAGLPNGCSSQNLSSLQCTPGLAGNYTVTVNVTDPAGIFATASTPVIVTPAVVHTPPQIKSFVANPSELTLHNSTQLIAVVSGGTAPYSYGYSSLPPGCTSENITPLTCLPTASGAFTITLKVTDSAGYSATASTALTVLTYPDIESFIASPASIAMGSATNLTVVASAGTPPYTYSFGGLPTGCASSNVSVLRCAPIEIGNFTVSVRVTDSHMLSATMTTKLEVTEAVVVTPLMTSLSANPNPVVAGNPTLLTATTSGGTPPYLYSYSGLPAGCATSVNATVNCVPQTVGTYNVTVTVSDAKGIVAKGQLSLEVTTAPTSTTQKTFLSSISNFDWMLIAIIAVVVLMVVLAVYLGRRRKPAPHDTKTEGPEPTPAVASVTVAGAAAPPPPATGSPETKPDTAATEPGAPPLPASAEEPEWSEDH